jgi:hypothetical protein
MITYVTYVSGFDVTNVAGCSDTLKKHQRIGAEGESAA